MTPISSPGRILVLRFSSLGDVILALPVARSLKAAFPGAEVSFFTRGVYQPLLEGQPGVDRVIALEEAPAGVAGLAGFCRGLGRFDLVVDLHRNLRSRICLGALRAARRESYCNDALERRLWAAGWLRDRMSRERRHVVDRYLEPLRRIGVAPAFTNPEVVLPPAELAAARELLDVAGVGDPERSAVIFPGARWPNKRWTAAGFAALAVRLRGEFGLQPVLAGDAADGERVAAVRGLIPGGAAVIAGSTGLRQLAAVLKIAGLAVANDSGPAHLAAAAGAPVVVLFGPTVPAFGFTPRGPRARVVDHDLPCRPCTVHGGRRCPRGRRVCLDGISPDEVLVAARALISPALP